MVDESDAADSAKEVPCPACAEPVRSLAFKCPHCGELLRGREARGPRMAGCWGPLLACLGMVPTSLFSLGLARTGTQAFDMPPVAQAIVLGGAVCVVAGSVLAFRYGDPARRTRGTEGVTLARAFGMVGAVAVLCPLLVWYVASSLITASRMGPEAHTIGALKTIHSAQELFKLADEEGDGNLDYGTLAELASSGTTGLIDSVLGSGTKNGYLFQVSYSRTDSEDLWFAVAEPVDTGQGRRYFATNQDGVTYYTTAEPFWLNDVDCEIPVGALPVGR